MKKFIIATTVTACIALCAAVWAQSEMVEEIPTLTPTATVCAAETAVAEPEPEEESVPTENEIALVPQTEESQKSPPVSESEAEPIEFSVDPEPLPVQEQASVSEPTQAPAPVQTIKELQPGDLVYVPGFGWVPYKGPNHCEDGTDIYENGNKIGIMG